MTADGTCTVYDGHRDPNRRFARSARCNIPCFGSSFLISRDLIYSQKSTRAAQILSYMHSVIGYGERYVKTYEKRGIQNLIAWSSKIASLRICRPVMAECS